MAFDRNRVVEGLRFFSDGSAGRLVGLQAEAGLLQGGQVLSGQTVALRVGFERERLLITLGFVFQQQSRLQHSNMLVGSAPVSLMFLVHVRGAERSPIYSPGRGKPLFVPIFTFSDD